MPSQAQETEKDMPFPIQGVDLSQAHVYQRPLTCETGKNVRAYEPVTNRAKGGARSGLSKYVPAQVPSGAHLIQHLNTVDPSVDSALLDWNLPWPNYTMPSILSLPPVTWGVAMPAPASGSVATIPDPSTGARNPGRDIPVGGTGFAPNRNKPSTNKIRFVQIKEEFSTNISNPVFVILDSLTSPGSFLFLAVSLTFLDPDVPNFNVTVSDSQGNTWTPISSVTKAGTVIGRGTSIGLQIWGAANIAGGPCTVTVTTAAPPSAGNYFFVLEYSGVKTVLPVEATGSGSGGPGDPLGACGLVTVSTPPQLVIGALGRAWTTASLAYVTGSLVRRNLVSPDALIGDNTAATVATNPTFSMAPADTTDLWVGLSVSLKHSW